MKIIEIIISIGLLIFALIGGLIHGGVECTAPHRPITEPSCSQSEYFGFFMMAFLPVSMALIGYLMGVN